MRSLLSGCDGWRLFVRLRSIVVYLQAGLGLIGMRVLRNWPEEGGWHEAIVTDFDAANMTWVLTYNFGHGAGVEKWEKFNILEADPGGAYSTSSMRTQVGIRTARRYGRCVRCSA